MGFFSPRGTRRKTPLPGNASAFSESAHGNSENSFVRLVRSKLYKAGPSAKQPHPVYSPSIASTASNDRRASMHSKQESGSSPARPSATAYSGQRMSTDVITITLAQRLDELAVAHKEGLLGEDEYRALRQNLFERFASTSESPAESSVVWSAGPASNLRISSSIPRERRAEVARTPSLRSQRSIGSAMSGLLRRATGRTSARPTTFVDDGTSIVSSSSFASSAQPPSQSSLPRSLSRQLSAGSLRTDRSRTIAHDLISLSSKRSGKSTVTLSDAYGSHSRNVAPPPSAFNVRHRTAWRDEDELKTTADIRAEIQSTEIEAQRLLDNFDGLELSILTRHRQGTKLSYDAREQNPHLTRSGSTVRPAGSRGRGPTASPRHGKAFSPSGVPGSTSNTDLFDVEEDDYYSSSVSNSMQAEMDDLRRRRIEVTDKYRQRLEYLKARLRGAEIHERLLRK